jgi:hypothetical protein
MCLTRIQFDAFLFGDFRALPAHLDTRPAEERRTSTLRTFHARNAAARKTDETLAVKQHLYKFLQRKITFGIGSTHLDSWTNAHQGEEKKGVTLAHSDDFVEFQRVFISLSYEILLPMLRNDLGPSELLAEQFLVAVTIIHEIAVSSTNPARIPS